MTFRIHALPAAPFDALFALSETELTARNIRRTVVSSCPGTPCHVSLADAEIGDTVLLMNYMHQPAQTPYRSCHAIFVRQGVAQAKPDVNEVPQVLRSRLISIRLFDRSHMLRDADVVDGEHLEEALRDTFRHRGDIAYAHLHYTKPGCFAAEVRRG